MKKMLVVGAGFAGAVIARQIAESTDFKVTVIDRRSHVAGNCHTERDADTGIMLHMYGAHIFHTSNLVVWDYIRRFGDFMPFINRPKAVTDSGIYSLPINLHTINQFFQKKFSPAEAQQFITSKADNSIAEPANFEEQALKFMGPELYYEFFYGYTKKHWGCEPRELPASILKRLPLRFNYNDNYYSSIYQGIPVDGYTAIVERILNHENIKVILNQPWEAGMQDDYHHTFYSGPLDEFYSYQFGPLSYRTLRWEVERTKGDVLGHPGHNFPSLDVGYTRRREHKHYEYWKSFEKTVVFTEYSEEAEVGGELYYPKRLAVDKSKLTDYIGLAGAERNVSFMGRLGTYRYLDMHKVIEESLDLSTRWLTAHREGEAYPIGIFQ
jgi:UDP-galactopyranose mutase